MDVAMHSGNDGSRSAPIMLSDMSRTPVIVRYDAVRVDGFSELLVQT